MAGLAEGSIYEHFRGKEDLLLTIPDVWVTNAVEELEKDYIRTARAKGLRERTVIYRHALKNGITPVLTVAGLQIGYLLGGAMITETVFAWPGMGRWLLDAVQSRNYPVIQIGVMLTATIFIFVNLVTDLLYPVFDPRIRLSSSKEGF